MNLLGGPSPDGHLLSFVDSATGDLAVRDLRSGSARRLTRNDPHDDAGQFAYFSIFSKDSRQVAYAWFNEEGFYDLRLLDHDQPGEPRVLYRNSEAGFVQPCDWSSDGKQILTLLFRKDNISQIALISTEDGSVRTLRSLNWVYPKKMSFSPDGESIVYDNLSTEGANEREASAYILMGDELCTLLRPDRRKCGSLPAAWDCRYQTNESGCIDRGRLFGADSG